MEKLRKYHRLNRRKLKAEAPRNYRGMTGEEVALAMLEDTGPKTMLSFSRGKNSIAAYLAIRDVFGNENITPYYLYLVPGLLSFERESLDYFEKEVFGRHIIRLPHITLFHFLNDLVLQPPSRIGTLQAAAFPNVEYSHIHMAVKAIDNLPEQTFIASGVRAADSPMRRLSMTTHGPVTHGQSQYYPVHDWNKERVIREIAKSGIKLPEDYKYFSRTFDGLDMRFLYPLKKYKPDDYKRVLEWYPLADMEIWLLEKRGIL